MSKDRLSVQANIMVSDEVVARTFAALARADWPNDLAMARALMQAMNAGAKAGGDRRCGKAASSTAFIGLYRKTDPDGRPWVELSVRGVDIERDSGTAQLNVLFRDWLRSGIAKRSTRTFIVP